MPERPMRPAFLDLTALSVCLVGFLGLITVVTQLKAGVAGIPRALFLALLAMTCAPFLLALVHVPKFPYLIPPIIAIFGLFLYLGTASILFNMPVQQEWGPFSWPSRSFLSSS